VGRGELKAVATQIEVEKQWSEDARQKLLPDDAEELFRSPEGAAPKSHQYEVLKMKLHLRKMELEADKDSRKAEAEKGARQAEAESRKAEAEGRKAEAEREALKAEAEREAETRKAEAERETRKLELEMELKSYKLGQPAGMMRQAPLA